MLVGVESVPNVDLHVYPVFSEDMFIFDMETIDLWCNDNITQNLIRYTLPFELIYNETRDMQNAKIIGIIDGMTNKYIN